MSGHCARGDSNAHDTDVWLTDLAACGGQLIAIEFEQHLLTDAETARAAKIIDSGDRDQWIAAHAALHLILTDRLGRRASFANGTPAGKPLVVDWDGDFSLAHSGTLAMIAVIDCGRIGIDIEVRRPIKMNARWRGMIEAAGTTLVPGTPLPEDDDEMRFLTAWTRLEAVAKLRGTGIGSLLEELRARGAEAVHDAARGWRTNGPDDLMVQHIDLRAFDAVATLATSPARGEAATIRHLSHELARING